MSQAQFNSEIEEGEDGDTVYNWVSLSTQSGDVTLFRDPITSFNGNSGNPEEMQLLATQINQFIQSNEPSLILKRDTRLNPGILLALVSLIAMSLPFFWFLLLLVEVILSRTVSLEIISKNTFIFDKAARKLTYQRKNFLAQVKKEHSFDEITRLEKEISNDEDKNDNYKFFLEYIEPYPFIKTSILEMELEPAIAEELSIFVGLPIQTAVKSKTPETPNPIKTVDKTVVFEGKKSIYYTTGIKAIPATESDIQEIHQKLLGLGFEFLGDLLLSKFEGGVTYYYVLPQGDIYAEVMKIVTGKVFGCNFSTDFASGASLSTNTISKIQDLKKHIAIQFNYPGLDISELYSRHRQHIIEIAAQEGKVKRVEPSLFAIAQSSDEFSAKLDEQ